MGSAEIACKSLDALLREPDVEVVGVVTQPDRCKGRKLKIACCPAKEHVDGMDIPVFSPQSINTPESLEQLRVWKPDLVVVLAYGQILKPEILEVAPLGCINVHTSLLPKYRGAAPIQWAVANGDKETGVTIMYMDKGMDTGDIILKRTVWIGDDETAGELHDRLAVAGAELLSEAMHDIKAGCVPRISQDESKATYAPKLSKKDGAIDWTLAAYDIHNKIRGFNPWPCCFCHVPDKKHDMLRILSSGVEDGCGSPGEVLDVKGDGPLIACGSGALRLLKVQPQGKRVMSGREYICGHALQRGEMLM
jgi:methionyl-tRNA formyltransferase